jgi:hypothetical protein
MTKQFDQINQVSGEELAAICAALEWASGQGYTGRKSAMDAFAKLTGKEVSPCESQLYGLRIVDSA